MPRFSILTHDYPFVHWDFLLEAGNSCRTWRLLERPDSQPVIAAESLPDHRLMYLNYEGPVSGDRGTVSAWDTGTFEWRINEPGMVEVILTGHTLNAVARIEQLDDGSWNWRLVGDEFARVGAPKD
jgi:hypothetical protein